MPARWRQAISCSCRRRRASHCRAFEPVTPERIDPKVAPAATGESPSRYSRRTCRRTFPRRLLRLRLTRFSLVGLAAAFARARARRRAAPVTGGRREGFAAPGPRDRRSSRTHRLRCRELLQHRVQPPCRATSESLRGERQNVALWHTTIATVSLGPSHWQTRTNGSLDLSWSVASVQGGRR